MLRYRVASLFSVEGTDTVFTNDHEAEIKALPRAVRDKHIGLGDLVEWDDAQSEEPPTIPLASPAASGAKTSKPPKE